MWTAVDVRVGQQDHLVVADLLDVELLGQAGADGGDQRLDLGVLEHLVDAGALDVEDLAPDGQDRLRVRVARVLGGPAGRVTLHDEELGLARVARRAVGQLAGQARPVERRLAPGQVAGSLGREAGAGRLHRLLHDLARLAGVLLQPFVQLLVRGALGQGADADVAELGLGLPFELRVTQADRDDGGEPLADVLPLEVLLLFLQEVAGAGVAVHRVGQRLGEPFDVHPALNGRDPVGEGVDGLVVPRVPLQRDPRPLGPPRPARTTPPFGTGTPSTR